MDPMIRPMGLTPRIRNLVVVAFAVSGSAGLILEVLWFRSLGIGGSNIGTAAAAVTASYMGGLAIGSRVGAFLSDRVERRLWLYAAMEITVAASALVVPVVLQYLAGMAHRGPIAWAVIGIVLLVPTTAIGTGLPLLTTCLARTPQRAASTSALLYGVNTGGAMLGVAWIGFVGLPLLGPELCTSIASLTLVLVASAAAFAGWRAGPQPVASQVDSTPAPRPRRAILGTAAVASGAAMLVQVAWTKLAASSFHSPATGFSGVVLIFLLGLSAGGLFASHWVRRVANVERALSWVLGATGLSVGAALLIGSEVAPTVDGMLGDVLVLLPLLPATLCMGLLFPLFVSLSAKRGASIGASVGITSAASTFGAIVGSLAGAALLPAVGAYPSVCGGLAIYAFLGTAVRLRLG